MAGLRIGSEDSKKLEALMAYYDENRSEVIRRLIREDYRRVSGAKTKTAILEEIHRLAIDHSGMLLSIQRAVGVE